MKYKKEKEFLVSVGCKELPHSGRISVIPRESLLLLFPVWLEHFVLPVTDDKKRYSISFAIAKPKEEGE
jgi:hypothetical protein